MYKTFTTFSCGIKSRIPKFLLIMKLTMLILFGVFMQVSATTYAQRLNFSQKNVSLAKVFSEIRIQTGYNVFLVADLKGSDRTDVDFHNTPLNDALNEIIKNKDVEFVIEDKTIIIKQKSETFIEKTVNSIKDFDVRGRVIDENGNPIAGATVYWESAKRGMVTDENGRFFFPGVSEKTYFNISFIGYLSVTIKAKPDLGDIILKLKDSKLDEVRVIAYGTDTRRFDVGAVNTITSKDIEKQPVNNPLLALQGLVPGLIITPSSGAPGSSVKVQIRGQQTLSFDIYDQPLFIIDGVPFAPQNNNTNRLPSFGTTNSITSTGGISPFNTINPNDIESITILKDADATSIYGSQGSNGVILITTKKGGGGKPNLDISAKSRIEIVSRPITMLNTQQYLSLRKDAFKNDGLDIASLGNQVPDLNIFDQNKYTNWYNEFFGKTAHNTDINASLKGGTNQTNYIATAGYTDSKFNFPGDFADKRFTSRTAFHNSGMGDRLTIDFGTIFTYGQNNSSGSRLIGNAFSTVPNAPDLLDANGNLVWSYKGYPLGSIQQFAYLKQPSNQQTYLLNSNLSAGYKIAGGLNFKINNGYSRLNTVEYQAVPKASQDTSDPTSRPVSRANFINSSFQTINIEPQLDYLLNKGKSRLLVLIGGTYKKTTTAYTSIQANGYANDALLNSIAGATNITADNGGTIYRYNAGFGRINYTYDEKYIISLTGRRDGSSNFGPGRQFGNFGSAGLGWIFSEASALKKAVPFISYGKLFGNYGTSGSDAIGPYQFQSFWKPIPYVNSFQGISPYTVLNHYNPDYSWSLSKKLNIAIDLGFLKNRILVNATWYQSRTGKQLINYQLPVQTGFIGVLQNHTATLQNKGWEFTLTSTNIKTKDITWSTDFNIGLNRNKLIAFPNLETSSYAGIYEIGQSTSIIRLNKFKGLNTTTGIYEFYKANGTVTNSPSYGLPSQGGDQIATVDGQPKFSGGFVNTFTCKKFSLSAVIQFTKQTAQNYLGNIYQSRSGPGGQVNVPVQALEYWKNPGDNTPFQRITSGLSYDPTPYAVQNAAFAFALSTGAYSDASYIRLKTLNVSYSLSDAYLKKMKFRNFRIFVSGQNLLTLTNYKVGDPELQSIYSFPLQHTIEAGLSFNL